jgi:hypothetical protein
MHHHKRRHRPPVPGSARRGQQGHLIGVALAGGRELCQHGRRDVAGGQPRAVRQHSAQQPCIPSRAAADIQAGDRAAGQELADRAHRRLVGGAQRLVDGGYPLEMAAHRHRHLPRCLCQWPSPARHAQFTHCSPARQAHNPQQAGPPPCGRPCTQACRPPACPAPAVSAGSDLLGNCRGWSSPAQARGRDPHLPGLAGCDKEMGYGNLPAAMRSWRQRPEGAWIISSAPSAKAWCDARS